MVPSLTSETGTSVPAKYSELHCKPSASQVRLYPDGSFSVSPQRPSRPRSEPEQFSYGWDCANFDGKQYWMPAVQENTAITLQMKHAAGGLTLEQVEALGEAYTAAADFERYERLVEGGAEFYRQRQLLGLVIAPNFHKSQKPKTRRGLNGMNNRQKRSVRSSAWVLAEAHRGRLGFFTVTIPGLEHGITECDRKFLNENWGGSDGVIKRLHQELKRELERQGLPPWYLSVAEFQEKRWRNHGQLALHQHVLLPVSRYQAGKYEFKSDRLREVWGNVLESMLGHPVDVSAAVDTKKVKNPEVVAKYLSKYMSKGGKILDELKALGMESQIPASWWSSSQQLKRLVEERTLTLKGDAAAAFMREMDAMESQEVIAYYPVEISHTHETTGEIRFTTVGYSGYFKSREKHERFLSDRGISLMQGGEIWQYSLLNISPHITTEPLC